MQRSNAYGVLKVLAAKNSNRRKLCRTRGILDVLINASWDNSVTSNALDA